MVICYSGRSAPSAHKIAECSSDIEITRSGRGDINWGRARANTELNPDISNVTNKRVMRELFREHNVPAPKMVTVDEIVGIDPYYQTAFTIVGRPDQHTQGRGFWLCRTPEEVRQAMRGKTYRNGKRKKAATHFMEYISKERAPREYRVHIFKGKSIRISEKIFDGPNSYTTGKPRHEVRHVRKAAKKALEAVGLDFGAVDILANDSECWVLEVNAAPGLGGSMPKLYADTFARWERGEL